MDTPVGKIRIPDELRHAAYTDQTTFSWRDGGMEILFWRVDTGLDGTMTKGPDGAIGDVVGRVFMTEEHFAALPRVIDALLNLRSDAQRDE